ncbi:ATP-binding protein [Streptomyces sp. Tu 3180]|nr:ATP-binding protein [Streptomyces sp. Tu 3180]
MEEWGHPPATDGACAVALVVGELAANAVRHGRVPGRDFRLRLVLDEASGLVRIEVADAAAAKRPPQAPPTSCPDGESGRGLLLVDVLAERWGSEPRDPVGKTVWAEVPLAGPADVPVRAGEGPGGRPGGSGSR